MNSASMGLLPDGQDVPFSDIESTMAQLAREGRRRKGGPARALTATVVVVGEPDRMAEAAEALGLLSEAAGVRTILISEGQETAPSARVTAHAIGIAGLAPRFLNNAVAALRLSSLPTAVWWRGGPAEALQEIAHLADRLVIDVEDPARAWRVVGSIVDETAVTDLRWGRLTRWRSIFAHLYDLPAVRHAHVRRLSLTASDPFAARLFAGWMRAMLQWSPDVAIHLVRADAPSKWPIESVQLEADGVDITVKTGSGHPCLHATIAGKETSTRIVPLGNGALKAVIGEELAVRSRDIAFERALDAALEVPAWP